MRVVKQMEKVKKELKAERKLRRQPGEEHARTGWARAVLRSLGPHFSHFRDFLAPLVFFFSSYYPRTMACTDKAEARLIRHKGPSSPIMNEKITYHRSMWITSTNNQALLDRRFSSPFDVCECLRT